MAKKNLSEIERGAGFFEGFVTGLMHVVREMQVPFEAIYRLATPEGRSTLVKIVELVREDWQGTQNPPAPVLPEPTVEEYDLEVDRGLDFGKAKAAGRYDYTNPDATAERFPIVGSGKAKVKARIVCFNRPVGDEVDESEVNNTLDAMGLKRGDTAETLAFGAQHPEVQRQKWIVSGSFWTHPDGYRKFLGLGRYDSGRFLSLGWIGAADQWHGSIWFLAVPK